MNISLLSTDSDSWAFGLRSISAVLKEAGHRTQLIFLPASDRQFSPGELVEIAALTHEADLIGVSCLAQGSVKATQVIDYLHARGKLVIWGGVHASLNPARCAASADIVCLGEGEEMMLELVGRLAQGRDWRDIRNIAFQENAVLHQNELRPPYCDLDKLPLPDFSFEHEYHLAREGFTKVSTLSMVGKSGQIIFNSSRGCAFHCTYCCNRNLKGLYPQKGHYVRRMSVARLIEHAQTLRQIFPQGKYFYFIDEDFAARPLDELVQLAEEFPHKVDLPFACLAHPARLSNQKLDLLVKAGIFRLYMGIESGSEHTRREIYDRHVSNEVILKSAQVISKYPQVFPTYFFIIANPYEEKEDLVETVQLISELPNGSYTIMYNLVFFPGSALYERAVEDGVIEGDHDSGVELNFLAGFHYKQHAWKAKNLYLNSLIFLLEGHITPLRIGIVPRPLLRALLAPRWIAFNESHPSVTRLLISLKFFLKSLRHWVTRLLWKVISNPAAVYNLRHHLLTAVFKMGKPESPVQNETTSE